MIEIFICLILCNRKLLVINLQRKPVHKGKLVANLVDHIGTRFNCNGSRLLFFPCLRCRLLLCLTYRRQLQRHRRGPVAVQADGGFELLGVPGRNRGGGVGLFLIAILHHNGVDDLALGDVSFFNGVVNIVGHITRNRCRPAMCSSIPVDIRCLSLTLIICVDSLSHCVCQRHTCRCAILVCHGNRPNDLFTHMGNRVAIKCFTIDANSPLRNAQIRSLVRILDGERSCLCYRCRCRCSFCRIASRHYSIASAITFIHVSFIHVSFNRQLISCRIILHTGNRVPCILSYLIRIVFSLFQCQICKVKGRSISHPVNCPRIGVTRTRSFSSDSGRIIFVVFSYSYLERCVLRQAAFLFELQFFLNQLRKVNCNTCYRQCPFNFSDVIVSC